MVYVLHMYRGLPNAARGYSFTSKFIFATAGSAKIYPRPKIKKTPPTKIGPFSNTYVWVKLMLKFWGYVSRAVFEILALKGPKLAQMAKHMIIGLEDQTRTFFHLISSTGYEFFIKISSFCFWGWIWAH